MYTKAARDYVQLTFGKDIDISPFTDEQCIDYVDKTYPGGMRALLDACARQDKPSTSFRHVSNDTADRELPDTPIRQRARIQSMIGTRIFLGPLDEWVDAKVTEDEIIVVLKVVDAEETSRRYKVNRTGMRMIQYKKPRGHWQRVDTLDIWDETPEYAARVLWGRIRDAERVSSDGWQQDNCYRPGTHMTPMQGPLAEMGTYHEEFFGRVTGPPAHTTATNNTNRKAPR